MNCAPPTPSSSSPFLLRSDVAISCTLPHGCPLPRARLRGPRRPRSDDVARFDPCAVTYNVTDLRGARRHYVELGAGDGSTCSSRLLREQGWKGLALDRVHENADVDLFQSQINAESISSVFSRFGVPAAFDHLTVAAGMNSFWVLHSALRGGYRPRTIATEFNRNLPPFEGLVTRNNATAVWNRDCYFGAGVYAFKLLFEAFGYSLVGIDTPGVNLFAVQLAETGGVEPLPYSAVLAGAAGHAPPCLQRFDTCSGESWVRLRDDSNLLTPRVMLLAEAEHVVLEQEVADVPGAIGPVTVFTAFPVAGPGSAEVQGEPLFQGCVEPV